MTAAKNTVFIVIIRKLLFSGGAGFWWRGDKNLVEGEGLWREDFSRWGEQIYSSPVGKALTTR